MQVTSTFGWGLLGFFGALILLAVVASVVGRIPERVDGTGILLAGGGVKAIEVQADGVVASLEVALGEEIERRQVVARLDLSALDAEIRTTGDRVAALESDYLQRSAARRRLERSLRSQIDQLELRRHRLAALVERGLKTRNDLRQIAGEITGVESQIHQLAARDASQKAALDDERRKLGQLEERKKERAVITSPYGGRVAAILKPAGQTVRAGEALIHLEEPGAALQAFVFVPFAQGQTVELGDEVRLQPTAVESRRHGYLVATVAEKSAQPVTFEEVRSLLQNEELARRYVRDTPYRIVARPRPDPACPGGLEWTTGCGPPQPLAANTACVAQVITHRKRPIQYVIPLLPDDRQRAGG